MEDGTRQLMLAIGDEDAARVKELLAAGVDVNAPEGDNYPLHWAAVGGDLNTVKLLLEHGADPSVRDSAGRTPAMDAPRNDHKELADYLEKSAAESVRH